MSERMPDIPRALIDEARDGDEEALTVLLEAAYPSVRRWALVHTGSSADADDLTQDVLIRMIRKLDSFHGDARFATWLYSVTRNAAADRFRRESRRTRLSEDPRGHAALVGDAPPAPADVVERRELGGALTPFFEELPQRQREAFDLVELQGLSAAEAAELLEIEPVSVRAHLFKARRRLRARVLESRPDLLEDLG